MKSSYFVLEIELLRAQHVLDGVLIDTNIGGKLLHAETITNNK